MKIILFGAHADDVETGMGGTASLLVKAGHDITYIVTTPPAVQKTYDGFQGTASEVRKLEALAAAKELGITDVRFLDFSEELNFPVTLTERAKFKVLMDTLKPDVVFTQWGIDVNPDHRSLCALSIEHCLQKGVNTELFCYEVFSEPGRPQSLGFYPTHYVNIDSVVSEKESAVRCHKSQNPFLWEANMEMQALRGAEMHIHGRLEDKYAEAFVRLTRHGNIREELAEIIIPTDFRLPQGMGIKVDPAAIGLQ